MKSGGRYLIARLLIPKMSSNLGKVPFIILQTLKI
jgi:hypothetical protein